MVDAVTSDEDKVAPVYKLEEICELLRSCHASIVKEVSDLILKKLEHKSPIVKQKVNALKCISPCVATCRGFPIRLNIYSSCPNFSSVDRDISKELDLYRSVLHVTC